MFDGGKAIVYISHIPMNPTVMLSTLNELEVAIKHLLFEIIVVIRYFYKLNFPLFSDLMN